MSTTQEKVTIDIKEGTKKLSQNDFHPYETKQIKRINIPASVDSIEKNSFGNLWGTIVSLQEKLWLSVSPDVIVDEATIGDPESACESSVVFKVLKDNGEYYFCYAAARTWSMYSGFVSGYSSDFKYFYRWKNASRIKSMDREIDKALVGSKPYEEDKIMTRLCRLATPYMLSEESKDEFCIYLNTKKNAVIKQVALFDCSEMLLCLFENGIIEESQRGLKKILEKANAQECMEYIEHNDLRSKRILV